MGGSQSSRLSRGISERSKGRKYSLESPSSIIHLFFFLHTFISRPSLHPSSISKLKRAFQRQPFQLGTLIWQTSLINRSRVCKTFFPHGWIYQYVNGCKEKDRQQTRILPMHTSLAWLCIIRPRHPKIVEEESTHWNSLPTLHRLSSTLGLSLRRSIRLSIPCMHSSYLYHFFPLQT